MTHDVEPRAVLFHGFSDRSRLRILATLAEREQRVSDIVESVGLGQPNVSAHLACLHDCCLVERERRGREVHYRLADGVAELLVAADAILDRAGTAIQACPRYGTGQTARSAA